MKKITLEFVKSLQQQQLDRGMFPTDYAFNGLHVPVETFLEFNDGDISVYNRDCTQYPIQWDRTYSDGLLVSAIGTSATAEKHGLPLPE